MSSHETFPDPRIRLPEEALYQELDTIDTQLAGIEQQRILKLLDRDRLLAVMAFRLRG